MQVSRTFVHNVLKTHMGESIPAPSEFGRNLSFALQNGHFSVSNARPYLPSVAEIACIHCKPAKPLPKVSAQGMRDGDAVLTFLCPF